MEDKVTDSLHEGVVSEEEATQLVTPILAFLQASGMSLEMAEAAFKIAWQKAQKIKSVVAVSKLQNASDYADIVSAWTKHPDFVDRNGLPKQLAYRGKKGFYNLVRRTSPRLQPIDALQTLAKYGNIKTLPDSSVKLVRPFFHVRSSGCLAFEPSARFLSDASATVRSLLGKKQASATLPQLFWRTADTTSLPASAIPAYIEFARSRSLMFLQEIDDWLQSQVKEGKPKRGRRVGLGLFSICGPSRLS
jgi:Family of unknown function (DUF6502)